MKESHLTGSHCDNSTEDDTLLYKHISLLLTEENKNTYAPEIFSNKYLHKNNSKQKVVSTEEDSNIFHMSERSKNTPCEEHTKNMVFLSDDALDDLDRNNTSYSPMRQVPRISTDDDKKKASPPVLEGEKLIDILHNKLPTYEPTIISEPGIDFQWPPALRGNPPVDASLKNSSFEGFSRKLSISSFPQKYFDSLWSIGKYSSFYFKQTNSTTRLLSKLKGSQFYFYFTFIILIRNS